MHDSFTTYYLCTSLILCLFQASAQAPQRTKEALPLELQELHKTFSADHTYNGFVLKGNPDPELVATFQERFERAAYAYEKMQLKAPIKPVERASSAVASKVGTVVITSAKVAAGPFAKTLCAQKGFLICFGAYKGIDFYVERTTIDAIMEARGVSEEEAKEIMMKSAKKMSGEEK